MFRGRSLLATAEKSPPPRTFSAERKVTREPATSRTIYGSSSFSQRSSPLQSAGFYEGATRIRRRGSSVRFSNCLARRLVALIGALVDVGWKTDIPEQRCRSQELDGNE